MNDRVLVPGFEFMPAWWGPRLHVWGYVDRACTAPSLLVVHCGSSRADVAGYLADPVDAEGPGAVLCHDVHWRRMVATHAAWSGDVATGHLVQMVGLERESWGTGTARWRGVVAQRIAIHVELPGPPTLDRAGNQLEELQRWTRGCLEAGAPLTHWVRHSAIDNTRRDPGPGLAADWAEGLLEAG